MSPLICWLIAVMLPEIWSSAWRWLFSSASRALRVGDQVDDLIAALRQHGRRFVGVGQQVSQLCVALVERLREPRDTLQRDPQSRVASLTNVSASTASESDTCWVSSPLMVVLRSPSASGSW